MADESFESAEIQMRACLEALDDGKYPITKIELKSASKLREHCEKFIQEYDLVNDSLAKKEENLPEDTITDGFAEDDGMEDNYNVCGD